MPVRIMSDAELTRFEILRDVNLERMPVQAAARTLDLSERQVWRLLKAFRSRGASGLISKRRGRPSNRAHGAVFRQTCLAIVRERYEDFGPTLAAEKLVEVHGLPILVENQRLGTLLEIIQEHQERQPLAVRGGKGPSEGIRSTTCSAPAEGL